jgi:hypothetical protein
MMSLSRLVDERKKRLAFMRTYADKFVNDGIKNGNDGWLDKEWFLSMFMVNVGVRERLAKEYFDIMVKFKYFIVEGEKFTIETNKNPLKTEQKKII